MIRHAALLWLALALPAAAAETIVSGLSQAQVAIRADFSGEEILVYGAVRREAPPPEGPLDVIVTVAAPQTPVTVRRKERRFGIWINTRSVRVDAAPGYYAVAATRPVADILSQTEDLRHRITVPRAIRALGATGEAADAPRFVEALIRLRTAEGRYSTSGEAVSLAEETLFRADFALPANLTEGDYRVRMFLLREGRVIDARERMIAVKKEGLERWIFDLSREAPLAYGILALVMAVVAGWGASAAFTLVRR